jgi:rubrerythrin
MKMVEALKTAMEMEQKIRDIYAQAFEACRQNAGKRFFAMMRDDEQYHHDYLAQRLEELAANQKIRYPEVQLRLPGKAEIASWVGSIRKSMAVEDRGVIQQMLSNALKTEVLTSEFYEKMFSESQGQAQKMFGRFLDIENGHIAVVQAELDYVMNTGYWFDFKEFDME